MASFRPVGLALLGLFLTCAVLAADEPKKTDPPKPPPTPTVAHIKLSGSLDESPAGEDPLFGSSKEDFKAKLARIKKAQKDANVKALYLHLDGLSLGFGKIDELSRVIGDFRASGKKVIAYLESGESKDYLAALACDQVLLPESGWLMLTGLRMEATFYKDLFDKVGIKADMLQMGAFKGAAEPFTRNKMSPENRQQLESVLDDYFEHSVVARLVEKGKAKKWTADQVKKLIDQGPFTAKQAQKLGLVDGLAYPDQIQGLFQKSLNLPTVAITKDYAKAKPEEVDLSNPFAMLKMLAPAKPKVSKKPKVAVIYAVGVINTGKGGSSLFGGDSVGSTTMIEAIRQAEEDETVKAIVLRVDSPGGSALASDLMWNELRRCKKPVIASMGDVAASGGYYISMACNKIYAEPGTLTGSIGVVGGKITFAGLYDTIGLKTEVIKRGQHADILTTDRPFSPSEREAFSSMMRDIYDQFLDKALQGRAKAGRKMSRSELENLAGGRIWTGRQAKTNGLVDILGTLDDAIADAWAQAKMPKDTEPELLVLPKPRSFLDTLMESLAEAQAPRLDLGKIPALREVTERLGSLDAMLRLKGEPVWLLPPMSIKVK